MAPKLFSFSRHPSFIDSALLLTLKFFIPLLFYSALLIVGTLAMIHAFIKRKRLPAHFALGASLTFVILILVTAMLVLLLRVRNFHQRIDSDPEASPSSPHAFMMMRLREPQSVVENSRKFTQSSEQGVVVPHNHFTPQALWGDFPQVFDDVNLAADVTPPRLLSPRTTPLRHLTTIRRFISRINTHQYYLLPNREHRARSGIQR